MMIEPNTLSFTPAEKNRTCFKVSQLFQDIVEYGSHAAENRRLL